MIIRLLFSVATFISAFIISVLIIRYSQNIQDHSLTNGEIIMRLLVLPGLIAATTLICLNFFSINSAKAHPTDNLASEIKQVKPFKAQVVGLQWLNPLQRMDYPTEWQLLWTLGITGPNQSDDLVKSEPEIFGKLRLVAGIADGNNGTETFKGYHHKYLRELLVRFRDIYFSESKYFYNAHSLEDKSTWRELAGIHVEYALPETKLDV